MGRRSIDAVASRAVPRERLKRKIARVQERPYLALRFARPSTVPNSPAQEIATESCRAGSTNDRGVDDHSPAKHIARLIARSRSWPPGQRCPEMFGSMLRARVIARA